jgi:thiol-disulfide isomerase/thioredoxin
MNTKRKTVFGIILFAVFLGVAYFAYGALSNDYKPSQETQSTQNISSQESKKTPAPDFTVFDTNGNKVKLSDFKGKPVVLNFWASWCPPCKGEMPHFNKIYKTEKNDVVFMMIDLVDGQRETQEKAQTYVKSQGFDFPIYFDSEQQAASAYGISSIPDTLFIDSDGNIVNAYQGAIDEGTLISGIKSIKR